MKLCILGAGRVLQHYIQNVFTPDFIASHDLHIFSNTYPFGLPSYLQKHESFSSLLSVNPDFLLVLTPSGLHYEAIITALDHNINVICEKPLCLLLEQYHHIVDLASRNNLLVAPIFQNRFNPAIQQAKIAINSGAIGDVKLCSVHLHWCREQSYYEDKWHGKWSLDGGVSAQQAIHHIDASIFLNGHVSSIISQNHRLVNQLEAEDTSLSLVNYSNGSVGTYEFTTSLRPSDREASIFLSGTQGYISISGVALNTIDNAHTTSTELTKQLLDCNQIVPTGYGLSHTLIINDILDSYANGVAPQVTLDNSLHTHSVLHSIYHSAESQSFFSILSDNPQSSLLGHDSKRFPR